MLCWWRLWNTDALAGWRSVPRGHEQHSWFTGAPSPDRRPRAASWRSALFEWGLTEPCKGGNELHPRFASGETEVLRNRGLPVTRSQEWPWLSQALSRACEHVSCHHSERSVPELEGCTSWPLEANPTLPPQPRSLPTFCHWALALTAPLSGSFYGGPAY